MRARDFERYFGLYGKSIKAIARKLANSDDELAEDLEQEGALALWLLDPRGASKNESAWIRTAVKNRMIDFLRKYNPQKYESLDARLETGDQVEHDEETGDIVLFTQRVAPPRLMDEELPWETPEEQEE